MIKKIAFLTLSILFYTISIYGQKDSINIYQVQYERSLTFEDSDRPFVSIYEYTKFIEFNKAIYKRKNKIKKTNTLVKGEQDDSILIFTPSSKNVSVVYKDYDKRKLYSKHEVAFKYFVVKDDLDICNWDILDEKKYILGYECQLASMTFRGRKYQAWFTSKLPVGGPWKYDGLPGMILEIKSMDNFIAFKAIGLKNELLTINSITNPFKTNKAITWQEFKVLYKKKAIELINYRPNSESLGIETSRGGIETYIDEDDKEYNNELKKILNK